MSAHLRILRTGATSLALGLALAAWLAVPLSAGAATRAMGLAELARSADSIIVATAGSPTAGVSGPARAGHRRFIRTDVPLRGARAIAGAAKTSVRVPGGRIGSEELRVSEMPTWVPGERFVLFLDEQGRLIGGEQGKVALVGNDVPAFGLSLARFEQAVRDARSSTPGAPAERPSQSTIILTPYAAGALASLSSGAITADAAAGAPTITGISPGGAIAGQHVQVTISGSGFGASQGTTGKVEFPNGKSVSASLVVADKVISWSDTAIVVEVPRYACAGNVYVTTSTGVRSPGRAYATSFSTGGYRYASMPVSYLINRNTPDIADEATQILDAFSTWNAAGSNFRVVYGGSTTYATSPYDPNVTSDDVNTISFSSNMPAGILALNLQWFDPVAGELLESDICFNEQETWVSDASTYTGTGAVADLRSLALHEIGHTVGLDDQYPNYTTPYTRVMGAYVYNTNRRALTQWEVDGALYLHGADSTPPTITGIASPTHADSSSWYAGTAARFVVTADIPPTGLSWSIDSSPSSVPDTIVDGGSTTIDLPDIAEGERWFHVRIERNGAWSSTSHVRFRADRTAPEASTDATSTYQGSATITLAASDALSGAAIQYRLDGAAEKLYTGPIAVSVTGDHQLTYRAIDGAGNSSIAETRYFSITPAAPAATAEVTRVNGRDRWDVAAAVGQQAFPGWTGVQHVVIASGLDRAAADPLAAAGLAGAVDAPVLLVSDRLVGGAVPAATEVALSRIRAANGGSVRIHVVGGTTSIPPAVYRRLTALKGPTGTIERIDGANRYALAATIANKVVTLVGADAVPGVLLANGESSEAFFDALAVSPASFRTHRPLLLLRGTSVPGETAAVLGGALRGKPRVVVNSSAFVSAGVMQRLGTTSRLSASRDRYASAAQIATASIQRGWLTTGTVGVTNKLPDALTAGSALGRLGGPVLYSPSTPLSPTTATWLSANRPRKVLAVGGPVSLAQSTLLQAASAAH